MGQAVSAAMLAEMVRCDEEGAAYYRKAFKAIEALLKKQKIKAGEWKEPEVFAAPKVRKYIASFPYEWMRLLTRARARQIEGYPVVPKGTDELDDRRIFADAVSMMNSHLLMVASDTAGIFVPVAFPEAILLDKKSGIPGSFLGSSIALMKELEALALVLGVTLEKRALADDTAKALFDNKEHALYGERMAWLTLWELGRVSVESKVSLVLH